MRGQANCERLCVWGVGIALGVTNGLCMMILALGSMYYGYGTELVNQIASVYQGYAATVQGSFIGFGWGFLDGFVCGIIIALVYNLVVRYCCNRV